MKYVIRLVTFFKEGLALLYDGYTDDDEADTDNN